MTTEDAYKLADRVTRTVLPAVLSYDDGVRETFKEAAQQLRDLRPVTNALDASIAIKLLKTELTPAICQYRDGMMTIPLRIAHWLCMVAIAIERGYAMPADYGSQGMYSACDNMGIPIRDLVAA